MKIAIIGCGNMGGAIARGLAADAVFASEHTIAASNRTQPKLDAIKAEYPQIETSTDNCQAAAAADIVVIAVKPWLIDSVAEGLRPVLTSSQTIVSVCPQGQRRNRCCASSLLCCQLASLLPKQIMFYS